MKAVIQRVTRASVSVDGETVGRIDAGLAVLLGVAVDDRPEDARRLAEKTVQLRIFSDAEGRFNLSLLDSGGAALVISQFTLLADTRKGRRPSFVKAAPPEIAEPLVEAYEDALREHGIEVASGRFGAHMAVEIINDGPVTIVLDTVDMERPRRG